MVCLAGDIEISQKKYTLGVKATYKHKWISDEEDDIDLQLRKTDSISTSASEAQVMLREKLLIFKVFVYLGLIILLCTP